MRLSEYFSLQVVAYLAMLLMSVPGRGPVNTEYTCKSSAQPTEISVPVVEAEAEADLKSELLFGF